MENPNLEQRLQRIETLLKSQKSVFTFNKKQQQKAKKISKVLLFLIEKIIELLLPYAIPFISHSWDNIRNFL